ncbi:MAG: plasmid mobilization relaxosome protein MobC [Oscillospiraceae bacterium]|nr:plasmid mobilization relaxosome protein MobC [Oscillospiraceae bacterium]
MRGRKKKDIPPVRPKVFSIRMSEDEYTVLESCAEQAQISMSEYIRRCVTGKEIPVYQPIIHDETEILKELHNINMVGSNLNQIARYFNQGGMSNDAIVVEIKTILQHLNDSCIRFDEAVEKEYGNR